MVTMSSEKVGRRGKGGESSTSSSNQQTSKPNHDDNPNHLVYSKVRTIVIIYLMLVIITFPMFEVLYLPSILYNLHFKVIILFN